VPDEASAVPAVLQPAASSDNTGGGDTSAGRAGRAAAAPTVLAEVVPALPALQQCVKRAGSVERCYTGANGAATMPTAPMRAVLGLVMLMGNAAAPTVLAEVAPVLPALQQRVKRAGSVERSYTGTDGTATMPTAAMRAVLPERARPSLVAAGWSEQDRVAAGNCHCEL
jgi:hypothetical protein